MVTHELKTAAGTPHPIMAAGRVIEAIGARNAELAAIEHPWVGAETYFLGEVHGGDFYNRFPIECRLVGTRRWAPGNTLEAVEAEFRALLEPIAAETGCSIDLDLRLVRGAYSIDPEHELARGAARPATRTSPARSCRSTGIKVVADGAVFQGEAGIPTVYHGPAGTGAHGDVEFDARRGARPGDAGLPRDARSACGRVSSPLPSYEELRGVVSVAAPRRRQHRRRGRAIASRARRRRSSSRTGARSPARSPSAS